jgi:hypothetical protein
MIVLTIDNSIILKYPYELFYYKLSQITQFVKGKPYNTLKSINIFLALLLVVFSIDLKYDEKIVVHMIDQDIDIAMHAYFQTPGIKTQKQIDDKRKSLTTKVKRVVDLTESLGPILNIYAGMYNKYLNKIPLILTPSQDYVLTDKKIIDLILKNNQTLYDSKSKINASIDLLYKKFKSDKHFTYAKDNGCALSKKYLLNKNSNYYTKYDFNKEYENNQNFYQKYLSYKKKYIKLKKINNM